MDFSSSRLVTTDAFREYSNSVGVYGWAPVASTTVPTSRSEPSVR